MQQQDHAPAAAGGAEQGSKGGRVMPSPIKTDSGGGPRPSPAESFQQRPGGMGSSAMQSKVSQGANAGPAGGSAAGLAPGSAAVGQGHGDTGAPAAGLSTPARPTSEAQAGAVAAGPAAGSIHPPAQAPSPKPAASSVPSTGHAASASASSSLRTAPAPAAAGADAPVLPEGQQQQQWQQWQRLQVQPLTPTPSSRGADEGAVQAAARQVSEAVASLNSTQVGGHQGVRGTSGCGGLSVVD
jgi:hypothetical protein